MSPAALLKLLEKYDVNVLQMPVYAGEIKEYDIIHAGSNHLTFINSLLLEPKTVYDDKNRLSFYTTLLNKESLEPSIDQFCKDIEWLVGKGDYYSEDIDRKRLDYIRENGMKVFGATVTGPIREIEKLLKEEQFHQYKLGGIEVWNWRES